MARLQRTLACLALLSLVLAPALHAKERHANFAESVRTAEYVVIATVKEVTKAGVVVLSVSQWLKGEATKSGEVTLKGETGFCVIVKQVAELLKAGERYALFVFKDGKPGRLGHILKLKADGAFEQPAAMFMDFPGEQKPKNADAFAKLVEAEVQKASVKK